MNGWKLNGKKREITGECKIFHIKMSNARADKQKMDIPADATMRSLAIFCAYSHKLLIS